MMRYILKLAASGKLSVLPSCAPIELDHLQTLVGGFIEAVRLNNSLVERGFVMLCDEEGKLNGYPQNEKATRIMYMKAYDYIVGDVVIVKADGDELVGMEWKDVIDILEEIDITNGEEG